MIPTELLSRRLRFGGGAAVVLLLTALQAQAEVKLPGLFSDHLVFQQGQSLPVWGWADEGEVVTVQFRKQKVTTTARRGQWQVRLKAEPAGGPDVLIIAGQNTIELRDVLVGEVWICSGQSNMAFALRRSFESTNDIATATNPWVRLFTVSQTKAPVPRRTLTNTWSVCSPETAAGFSAVAYYFGRELQRARSVPVGLIHTSWGGSPAEVWMSEAALANNPEHQAAILDAYPAAWQRYQQQLAQFETNQAAAKAAGRAVARPRPGAPWKPADLYNGMLAPLMPYAIKGAIWYQGEANASRAAQYRTLFPDLIRNWRRDWGQGDFPFLAVQLAPYMKIQDHPTNSTWAELREAQSLATRLLPKVGLAVITDVGNPTDIHPNRKAPVGERLALAARGIAYGEPIVYSGPVYKSMTVRSSQAIVRFDHVGRGLAARGGELQGFALCGTNRNFVWAQAKIQGATVVVSSPEVAQPFAVRYGWADCPVVNLWNSNGLPASPFRTDNFPLVTAPKPPTPAKPQ